MYVALKIKMNDRKLMLRKVKTGNLMTSQRLSESQTKQSYPCAKAHNVSHENKETILASTFSSPPMGRDENVLKCFLLSEINDDFDIYRKKVLERRCCSRQLQMRVIGVH